MKRTAIDPERVDVVVIGAGIAGLTAAALLAHAGHPVTVLERDAQPGGCAASFRREGYRFAVGATVGMGFEPGGVHASIYERLGLTPSFVNVDPAIRVHLPDRTVHLYTGRARWLDEVAHAFPMRAGRVRDFWTHIGRLGRGMRDVARSFPVLPLHDADDVLDTARAFRPSALPIMPWLASTVADLLERHGLGGDALDERAHRAFVDGQLIDAMQTDADGCVAPCGALALDIYRNGCQYVPGGLQTVARDLVGVIERCGGEVRYGTRVRALLLDGSEVRGVTTNRGDIHCRSVVSAIPLADTAELAAGPGAARLRERAEALPRMWGAVTLYAGVDERVLPKDVHPFEQVTSFGELHDGGNALVSISPPWDRSRAPAGKRAITMSTHVDAEAWLRVARDPAAYRAAKERMQRTLLERLEHALPGIGDGIEVLESGTPKTFRAFTLRSSGTVGGIPQTPGAALFAAPSHRTGVKGLFLAGDTIFPGQGTVGVSISGFNAARSARRFLLRSPRVARSRRSLVAGGRHASSPASVPFAPVRAAARTAQHEGSNPTGSRG